MTGEREELRLIAAGGFDPRSEVLVQRDAPGVRALAGVRSGGIAAVTKDQNSVVSLRAHLSRAGIVVLDDAMASGWSVTVDGRPHRPLEVDDVMRGVIVPAGTHTITWSYRVPGLRLGAILSALALVAVVAGVGVVLVRRRLSFTRAP
jgi:uncharacterized membrane protein YfhO